MHQQKNEGRGFYPPFVRLLSFLQLIQIKWALRFFYRSNRNTMGVDHGSLQTGVPKQRLNGTNIIIGLQKMCSEGVTEGVGGKE